MQQFFNELEKDPKVFGLILFGSYARGDNRPDSDIDLLVISEGETERKIETRDGKIYEMIWVAESEALKYWETDKDGCYGVWQDAKVVFDKTGTTDILREGARRIIAEGKKELTKLELTHKKFDAEDQLRAIKGLADNDISAANYALHKIVSIMVELFFDIERIWAPPSKKALQIIRSTNPRLGALLDSFYASESNFDKSVNLATGIIQETFRERKKPKDSAR